MLQPEQLKRVEEQHTWEIAELRGFFESAGIQTGTSNALAEVADRLVGDHAFERDLRSHVWVVLHGRERQISYANLLGMLALAAAGPAFAPAAEAGNAHDLLRFLMHARESLLNTPMRDGIPSTLPLNMQGTFTPRIGGNIDLPRRGGKLTESAAPQELRSRTRTALTIASAVFAVIVFSILWLHGRSTFEPARVAAIVEKHSESNARPQMPAAETYMPASRRAARMAVHPSSIPRVSSSAPLASPLQEAASPMAATSQSGGARAPTTPVTVQAPPQQGAPAPIPSALLSQRLGSRSLPPDYLAGDSAYDTKYPRLLRRRLLLPLASEQSDTSELVASNETPALFREGRDSPGSSVATTVRPVSLGIMAANILYSPAPAYPPAAAAAHVQGEVKVQAEVDRNGNVASARVISGPPLLRDAAMDAVQRWRYRPYLSAGKPVAMSATAVLDFQMQ